MFEQSQLELASGGKGNRASMIMGFALQALMLAGALLFSLIFTEAVPRLRFDASLMAPPRARSHVIAIEQPARPAAQVPVALKIRREGFFAPTSIPKDVVILDKAEPVDPAPPDTDPAGWIPIGSTGGDDGDRFLLADASRNLEPDMPPPPPQPQIVERPSGPVRVGGEVAAARLVHRAQPVYPPIARQARIQGMVRLEAVISEDGEISNLRVLSGHPLLIQSALDAVAQWRYQPTLLNGHPVAVITTVDVNFVFGSR
jgi:protein TonB